DGGVANAGQDSRSRTFTITVTPVNDAPTFTPGGPVSVDEDSGPYAAIWATTVSAGPNEAGQDLTFSLAGNSNPSLFSAAPAMTADGTLSFTPAPDAYGTATLDVALADDGGTANGGSDTTIPIELTITVLPVNDPPVAGNDS